LPIHRVAIVLIDMQSRFDVHSLWAAANLYLLNALLVVRRTLLDIPPTEK
jgi:hypothetical protein